MSALIATTTTAGTERAYQRLAAEILELIVSGEFTPGQRLPSERALADRFDVSRTSVREAIIALELQRAVEVRVGSGIYVCPPQDVSMAVAAPLPRETGAGPFELLRARCLIESEIAAMAATTRKDADLDRIFGALTTMGEQLMDKSANAEADRMFHLHIAEATGNSVLLHSVTSMWDQARGPIWAKIEQHFHTRALREASQADHQRIFQALVAADAQAARLAMRGHLERVIGEFAQAWR
ncbi:FadR family transcriptional regulator [Pigmentiphaga aceris]|uniref:FadR family transcriptional regulator n=1 Tax=Pigmentiphaga aceris TaxID=1940612 RepID=A0A5C0AR10_9BURK|nr:FadR/GntR family transcriptional regulator [Pigmentiphaga aceris]QEI04488.1 FadR family transcriptional regulator [Pigmentiphaga aceris]